MPVWYKYRVDDQIICKLEFEFILQGDLVEISYIDYKSDGVDNVINPVVENQDVAIDKLLQQIQSGYANFSKFKWQFNPISNNENKYLHLYVYGKDKKEVIGDVSLKYKNGHAYLKHEAYELNVFLDKIYAGDLRAVTDIINSRPELVNTPLIKQNVRTGAIEIITYPLIEAILFNQVDIVKILIDEKNATLNATTSAGITPLYAAMLKGNKELSYKLMSRGGKLTEKYKYPVVDTMPVKELFTTYHLQENIKTLFDAIKKQDVSFIKQYIIEKGYNVRLPYILPAFRLHIFYPIIAAIGTANLEIIKLIIEQGGASVNVSNYYWHWYYSNSYWLKTPYEDRNTSEVLFAAVDLGYKNIPKNQIVTIIDYLIKQGAYINSICGFGWTPLIHAVQQCSELAYEKQEYDFTIIEFLLKHGADINLEIPERMLFGDDNWGTALGTAVHMNDIVLVKYLLDKGARVLTNNKAISPLEAAKYPSDQEEEILQEIIDLLKQWVKNE